VDGDSLVNQGRVAPLPLQVETVGMEDGARQVGGAVHLAPQANRARVALGRAASQGQRGPNLHLQAVVEIGDQSRVIHPQDGVAVAVPKVARDQRPSLERVARAPRDQAQGLESGSSKSGRRLHLLTRQPPVFVAHHSKTVA